MARIRSIKPEFWTSAQIMECSTNARLMFIGMWNFADDAGRMPFSPKTIKAQVFPSDDLHSDDVRRWLDELSTNGLIMVYAVDGKEFLQITGWAHQKIDRPQPPKYPAPFFDDSTNARRTLATDLRGSEGKGEEEDAPAADAAHSVSDPPAPTDEAELYRRSKTVLGASAGGMVKKLITAKGGSIPLARAAIEQAATKGDAREYIGRIIRGRGDSPEDLRARGEAW